MEEWRDIIGYEGLYKVSNTGKVIALTKVVPTLRYGKIYNRTIPEHFMTLTINNKGYYKVKLTNIDGIKKNVSVHRLVACAFLEPIEGKTLVNHKDENKLNNNISNLEWCNVWENNIYGSKCKRIGNKSSQISHTWLYKSVLQYSLQGELINEFKSIKEASIAAGLKSSAGIQSCCVGRLKSSGGYIWKYKEDE